MNDGLVERLLAERIGLDRASVGENLIENAVKVRMRALGLRIRSAYERLLIEGDELQSLIEEVVIPESWFLRDGRPFEILADFARTGWVDHPDRPPLSALSVPCAGGEEPYSIAITLIEQGLPPDRFRVDAVDISARSLSRAIAANYSPNAFRGTPDAFREKHFRAEKGRFVLDRSIREAVRFQVGNILDPKLLASRPSFDVVFCRNLLIYFDEPAKVRAFETLDRLTVRGGLLFLGHADRRDPPSGSPFRSVEQKGAFGYVKGGRSAPIEPVAEVPRAPLAPASPAPARAWCSPSGIAIDGADATPPAPASAPPARPGPTRIDLDAIISQATGMADLGRYEEASALVDQVLARGLADARAHFLLGLIRQASGDRGRAEAEFHKAVYLDPQHDEALIALALLARRKGDVAAEAAFRRRADRVIHRKGASPP